MMRLLLAALLLLLAAACAVVTSTPGAAPAPTATAFGERATTEAAQAAPPATATHDAGQFPPLAQLEQTGTPRSAASAAGGAPTSQVDSAALTATAIVARATARPAGAAQAAAGCAPSAFSADLNTQAAQAQAALVSAGLEPAAVTITSVGVAGVGGGCADLLPLYTTLAATLPLENLDDAAALADLAARALAALAGPAELAPESLPGAHPALLALTFRDPEGAQRAVAAPYAAALAAHAAGLRGADLLLALGAA